MLREHRKPLRITIHPPDAVPCVLGHLMPSGVDRYELFDSLFVDRPLFLFHNPTQQCCCDCADDQHANKSDSNCCVRCRMSCLGRTCCCRKFGSTQSRNSIAFCNDSLTPTTTDLTKSNLMNNCTDRCNARLSQLRISSQPLIGESFGDLHVVGANGWNNNGIHNKNLHWTSDNARNPLHFDSIPSNSSPSLCSFVCGSVEKCFACSGFRCSLLKRPRWSIKACKLQTNQQIGFFAHISQRQAIASITECVPAAKLQQLQMPINLELRHKTLLLAASLYLNYVHFV